MHPPSCSRTASIARDQEQNITWIGDRVNSDAFSTFAPKSIAAGGGNECARYSPKPIEMTGNTTQAVSDAVDFARSVKADRHRDRTVRTLGGMAALYQLS